MSNIFTRVNFFSSVNLRRFIALAVAIFAFNLTGYAQVSTYTSGTLTFETTVHNPCGTPTPNNGYIDIKIIAAGGGAANLIFITGPTGINAFNVPINLGSTYRFNTATNLT